MGLSVGFDSMFNRLMNFPQSSQDSGFPPYNIRKEDDYKYVIELALAGTIVEVCIPTPIR